MKPVTIPPAVAALPRFPLLDGPSPLQRLERFSAALGGKADIWIKREDLLPLAFGGNKLRNLEFLVGAALAEGADTLVTSGRRWSNHCRLTAAAGARAGLDVDLVFTGPPTAAMGANERLERLMGARIHVAETNDRPDRERLVHEVMAGLQSAGRRPYMIGVGGSGPIGAAGQVLAGIEVADQLRRAGMTEPATIVLPSATGGTQAGLLAGLRVAGIVPPATVLGIAVATPSAELRPTIEAIVAGLRPLAGVDVDPTEILLSDDERGAGYGIPTPDAEAATALLAQTEGIFVDPIYTAKALAGLIARCRSGELLGPVVFWHAGGTPGLFENT